MFKKTLDYGGAGDNVGCLLRTVKRDDVQRGQVLAAPGSVKTYKEFEAELYVLTQEEGRLGPMPSCTFGCMAVLLYYCIQVLTKPFLANGRSLFVSGYFSSCLSSSCAYPCFHSFIFSFLPPCLPACLCSFLLVSQTVFFVSTFLIHPCIHPLPSLPSFPRPCRRATHALSG